MQGGLEIPCNLTASFPGYSARSHALLEKYLKIVRDLYVEPTNEEIIGSFLIPNEESGHGGGVMSEYFFSDNVGVVSSVRTRN